MDGIVVNRHTASRALAAAAVALSLAIALAPAAAAEGSAPSVKILSLETGAIGIGAQVRVGDVAFATPTLGVPTPAHADTGLADAALDGTPARDALPDEAAMPGAGRTPERAILVQDAGIPLLPDYAVTLYVGGGHNQGMAKQVAHGGTLLSGTGLAVAFDGFGGPARESVGHGRLAASSGDVLPAGRGLEYDPARDAHAPLGAGADEDAGDAGTTAGARGSAGDVSVSGARAADGTAGASALAKKAAVAAAALSLPALLGWTLYHRIRGHATLDNPTRKAVYEAIESEPGIGVQALAKRVDVSYSTAMYHLNRLLSAHMIVQAQDGNKLRYYKNGGTFNEKERHVLPLLKNREALRVLSVILQEPGTYRARIAERMGVTATTVNWHLKRLAKTDLIHQVREGRSAHLYVDTALLRRHLEPLVPKLDDADAQLADVARDLLAHAQAAAPEASGHAASKSTATA